MKTILVVSKNSNSTLKKQDSTSRVESEPDSPSARSASAAEKETQLKNSDDSSKFKITKPKKKSLITIQKKPMQIQILKKSIAEALALCKPVKIVLKRLKDTASMGLSKTKNSHNLNSKSNKNAVKAKRNKISKLSRTSNIEATLTSALESTKAFIKEVSTFPITPLTTTNISYVSNKNISPIYNDKGLNENDHMFTTSFPILNNYNQAIVPVTLSNIPEIGHNGTEAIGNAAPDSFGNVAFTSPIKGDETEYRCPICNIKHATAEKTLDHATRIHFRRDLSHKYRNLYNNKILECPICQFESNDHLSNLYHIGLVHNKIYDFMSPGN